ncbi:MAG: OmpH family outer membrane protein [Thermoanaerobaculia bacterium]
MRISRKTTVHTFGSLWLGMCVALIAGQISAQPNDTSGTPRVGVIDVQRLVLESAKGQAVLEKLRNLTEQKQAEADAIQQAVRDLQTRVEAGRASLSEERLAEVEKELEDKIIEYQRFEDDAERQMQEQQAGAFEEIESEMMPIITRAGAELQYTVIFNKFSSGLLFAKDEADITDLILERYNAASAGEN